MERGGSTHRSGVDAGSARRGRCAFCERINPPDAKFCNACGAPLHLAACPQCGAINYLSAVVCHQCDAQLPVGQADRGARPPSMADAAAAGGAEPAPAGGHGTGLEQGRPAPAEDDERILAASQKLRELLAEVEHVAALGKPAPGEGHSPAAAISPEHPPAAAAPSTALQQSPARVTVLRAEEPRSRRIGAFAAVAVLAAIAGAAYYAYDRRPVSEVARGHAAVGEPAERGGSPAAVGRVSDRAETSSAEQPAVAAPGAGGSDTGGRERPPARAEAAAPAAAVPAAVPPSAADRSPGAAPPSAAGPAASLAPPKTEPAARSAEPPPQTAGVRPRTNDAAKALNLPPQRLGPCTEAVAALGLCRLDNDERRQ